MGCCGCGHKSWTNIFTSFSIIFCLAQIGAQLFILYCYHKLVQDFEIVTVYIYLDKFTLGLSITSVVFNVLWIIASIDVLVHLRKSEIVPSLITGYVLWDIGAIASFIIDVVSIILYGLKYDENNNYNLNLNLLYMIIISSHFIIGFVFNIFAIIGMLVITSLIHKKLGKQPKKRLVPLKPPKPVLKKPTREAHLEENNIDRVRDWYNHYENKSDYQKNPNNVPVPNIPRLNEIPRENELKRNSNSPNNYDAAPNQHGLIGSNTNVLVNGVPSGTLRRQLPWTYMPNPNELPHMQPRKQPIPVSTPYVPAPDYYRKNPNPISRRDFHEPGWSQHL